MNPEHLRRMIAEDEFGLLTIIERPPPMGPDERLVAAYREVVAFVSEHGHEPRPTATDVTEYKLAKRLEAMSLNEAQRTLLEPYDDLGLLREPTPPASLAEALADDSVGLLDDEAELFQLKHVPKSRSAPERMARRQPCPDFDNFKPLFAACHADLRAGIRKLLPFHNPQQITDGSFFVLSGVLVYVAHIGERRQDATGDSNARTRCIFENGTESDLLLRSLASQLYQDGKRVTESEVPSREHMELEPDTPMGIVYVLRSLSNDLRVRAIPHLHKIGCTVQTTEQRTRDAVKETTYLMNPVEIVAEYKVPAGVEEKIEHVLHRLFDVGRLDVAFEREGTTISEAREWFSVPLHVIDEAVNLIESETITNYEYDPAQQQLRLRVN